MKYVRISLMVSLAIVIVLSGIGISASPAQAATCTQYHTVKSGETLYKIGLKYGVTWTYLANLNNLSNPNKIYAGQVLCVSTSTTQPPAGVNPTFVITAVVRDQSVTIYTYNFPANDTFTALMGPMGTQGKNGIQVGKVNSGKGGSFSATFTIPNQLKGAKQIAIRLQSPTSGFFAYNWFYNNTTGSSSGSGGKPQTNVIPTFTISAVVRDTTVTITTKNFPANLTFDVLMGPMGTKAINGIKVGTMNSGSGGSFNATFYIPANLQGSKRIAIRTENKPSGYFSYNWFYNNTTN